MICRRILVLSDAPCMYFENDFIKVHTKFKSKNVEINQNLRAIHTLKSLLIITHDEKKKDFRRVFFLLSFFSE